MPLPPGSGTTVPHSSPSFLGRTLFSHCSPASMSPFPQPGSGGGTFSQRQHTLQF